MTNDDLYELGTAKTHNQPRFIHANAGLYARYKNQDGWIRRIRVEAWDEIGDAYVCDPKTGALMCAASGHGFDGVEGGHRDH